MNRTQREKLFEERVSFLNPRIGKHVTVRGIWMGDFLGCVSEVNSTYCKVKVVKGLSGQPPLGEDVEVPYAVYATLNDPTPAEGQMEFSEQAPDIVV